MTVLNSQTDPGKKSRRFYIILGATILLIVLIASIVAFQLSNINQTNYGPGPVVLEVSSSKPSYVQGEEVSFTIYVNNPQDWPVPHPNDKAYRIKDENGTVIFIDDSLTIDYPVGSIPTYPAHQRTFSRSYSWNQEIGEDGNVTLVPPGNYTLTVTFSGIVDYGESGSYTFEIR